MVGFARALRGGGARSTGHGAVPGYLTCFETPSNGVQSEREGGPGRGSHGVAGVAAGAAGALSGSS